MHSGRRGNNNASTVVNPFSIPTSGAPHPSAVSQTKSLSHSSLAQTVDPMPPVNFGSATNPRFPAGMKGMPKQPAPPYVRYSKKVWDEIRANNTQMSRSVGEVGKMIGDMWRNLPEDRKRAVTEEYEAEKAVYQEQVREYQNSQAYHQFLAEKNRSHMVEMSGRVTMTPHAEDSTDAAWDPRAIAMRRYSLNQSLLREIFDPLAQRGSVLEEARFIVSQKQLDVITKKSAEFSERLKRARSEVDSLEPEFEKKMKKMTEARDNFKRTWSELSTKAPVITPENFEAMIAKHKEELIKKQKQQKAEAEERERKAKEEETAREKERARKEQEEKEKREREEAEEKERQAKAAENAAVETVVGETSEPDSVTDKPGPQQPTTQPNVPQTVSQRPPHTTQQSISQPVQQPPQMPPHTTQQSVHQPAQQLPQMPPHTTQQSVHQPAQQLPQMAPQTIPQTIPPQMPPQTIHQQQYTPHPMMYQQQPHGMVPSPYTTNAQSHPQMAVHPQYNPQPPPSSNPAPDASNRPPPTTSQ